MAAKRDDRTEAWHHGFALGCAERTRAHVEALAAAIAALEAANDSASLSDLAELDPLAAAAARAGWEQVAALVGAQLLASRNGNGLSIRRPLGAPRKAGA